MDIQADAGVLKDLVAPHLALRTIDKKARLGTDIRHCVQDLCAVDAINGVLSRLLDCENLWQMQKLSLFTLALFFLLRRWATLAVPHFYELPCDDELFVPVRRCEGALFFHHVAPSLALK